MALHPCLQAHIDVVGKSVHAVFADPQRPGGLEMVYGPEDLRFCQAHFMPLR